MKLKMWKALFTFIFMLNLFTNAYGMMNRMENVYMQELELTLENKKENLKEKLELLKVAHETKSEFEPFGIKLGNEGEEKSYDPTKGPYVIIHINKKTEEIEETTDQSFLGLKFSIRMDNFGNFQFGLRMKNEKEDFIYESKSMILLFHPRQIEIWNDTATQRFLKFELYEFLIMGYIFDDRFMNKVTFLFTEDEFEKVKNSQTALVEKTNTKENFFNFFFDNFLTEKKQKEE